MVWNVIIPIVTFIAGLAAGFFLGVYYLRKQLEKIQNNPEMLKEMAKKLGYNLNSQQLNRAQQLMRQHQKKRR